MFDIEETKLPGLSIVHLPRTADARGAFSKVLHAPTFEAKGLRTDFVEQFFTVSGRNVLRGMHCQLPPNAHAKLVTCVHGSILDVVVDLRSGTNFGRCIAVELNAKNGKAMYLPVGCAHGFLALSDQAVTLYNVTSVHAPKSDSGVYWRSIDFDWPVTAPIISSRDEKLPGVSQFENPFAIEGAGVLGAPSLGV